VPLFMGITGVNEHIELVFNAVLSNAVVMLRSLKVNSPQLSRSSFAVSRISIPCFKE